MSLRAWLSLLCLCSTLMFTETAAAQTPGRSINVLGGSGVSLGTGGGGQTTMLPSPATLDAGASFWNSERPDMVFGVAGRVELTGRTSLGVVPRVGLHREFGPITLRPSVAAVFFFSPFSLLGAEGAVTARYSLGGKLWVLGRVNVDAFFWGSDLPDNSTVVMINGALGVELEL